MAGPYETQDDAVTEVRDIYAGHCKRGVMRERTLDLLLRACAESGVELGGYDRRVLRWLATQPPEVAQVVASLIARAADQAPSPAPPSPAPPARPSRPAGDPAVAARVRT
ncbi:hypothetical protein [Actinomadura fibrosa]|uniref:Uncharacterized protein n=1 Tax=Actinomadura fibrosa TaxID=111802 RepID=A0ABW2XKN0_9ACTN|nr:hypothetical protein [Actinomadura fibrosa]